jgi:hypothetical protein
MGVRDIVMRDRGENRNGDSIPRRETCVCPTDLSDGRRVAGEMTIVPALKARLLSIAPTRQQPASDDRGIAPGSPHVWRKLQPAG